MSRGVVVFVLAWAAMAQDSPQPRVLTTVAAEYSDVAQTVGVKGSVLLEVTVGVDGKPSEPKVLREMGFGLDEKAVEALMKWTFQPAMKNGEPVSTTVKVEMNFRMITKGRGALERMTFALGPGVVKPVMTVADLPPAYGETRETVEFDVTPAGDTENYKVSGAMAAAEEKLLLGSVRKWKSRPAMRDGLAVVVRGTAVYVVK